MEKYNIHCDSSFILNFTDFRAVKSEFDIRLTGYSYIYNIFYKNFIKITILFDVTMG